MNALYELVGLLPASFQPSFSSQQNDLFHLLRKERLTEKEAALKVLKSDQRNKYFNKLKNKLKVTLTNTILASPPLWANTSQKEWYDRCQKNRALYKILLASGSRKAAVEIAAATLSKAKELELFTMVYSIACDLEHHYSSIDCAPAKAKKYASLAGQYLEIIKAERLVKHTYNQISILYNSKNTFTAANIQSFAEAVETIKPLLHLNSRKITRLIYNVIICRYYAIYDYPTILQYCAEALGYYAQRDEELSGFHFTFLQKKIPALIALGQLEEAKISAKTAGKLVTLGKYNWHLILIQRIEVCFHAADFQEAYELYKAHQVHPCHFPRLREYWNIIRGYLYFLIQSGKIEAYHRERFNLGKFLNEVPIYSRDKAGVNINILILQILIQMQREQYGRIIDRIEALSAYARKHTRTPATARAHTFINMIVRMEAAFFHKEATRRKAGNLLQRLNKIPLKMGQSIAVEIIPYPYLWEEILAMLDNKRRAVKRNKGMGSIVPSK